MNNSSVSSVNAEQAARSELNYFDRIKVNWLLYKGENQKAVDILVTDLEKEKKIGILNLAKVRKLIDIHVYIESQDYLEAMLGYNLNPEQTGDIYLLLARCCYGQGQLEQALQYLEYVKRVQPANNEYCIIKADCLLELGEWEEAAYCLNQSLRSSPGDAEAIFRLGSIYFFHGEYEEALSCFSGCCKLKPHNPDYWEMKGEMFLKLNQIIPAADCFHKAVKYGGSVQILTRLAYCYAKTGLLKKAKKLLSKVLRYDSSDFDAICNLASVYHKLGNDDQAYQLFKKAYILNCNDSVLLNNLGYISFKLGRTRKAIEFFSEALKINPQDRTILYNLGVCYSQKGKLDLARTTLEQLASLDQANPDAWIVLGNVYEKMSKYKNAVDCFNRSLGLAK